jgi:hypothetical protein
VKFPAPKVVFVTVDEAVSVAWDSLETVMFTPVGEIAEIKKFESAERVALTVQVPREIGVTTPVAESTEQMLAVLVE